MMPPAGHSRRRDLLTTLHLASEPPRIAALAVELSRIPVWSSLLPALAAKLDQMRLDGTLEPESAAALGRALARSATVADVDVLVRIAKDPGYLQARGPVITRLARWRIPSLIPEFMCLLQDEAVRPQALRFLARQKEPRALLCIAAFERAQAGMHPAR